MAVVWTGRSVLAGVGLGERYDGWMHGRFETAQIPTKNINLVNRSWCISELAFPALTAIRRSKKKTAKFLTKYGIVGYFYWFSKTYPNAL